MKKNLLNKSFKIFKNKRKMILILNNLHKSENSKIKVKIKNLFNLDSC